MSSSVGPAPAQIQGKSRTRREEVLLPRALLQSFRLGFIKEKPQRGRQDILPDPLTPISLPFST